MLLGQVINAVPTKSQVQDLARRYKWDEETDLVFKNLEVL